jgi:predicted HTH transcriptional regulator
LKNKLASLEEELHKLAAAPPQQELKTETTLPVIPIRRDKALASLTETEVAVLEFLSTEGPKTAPEIKEKVQLSREHTARLMKKLYEDGYVERETDKLPFKYRVKAEMEKLLKKPEPTTT